jgi:ribose 5-phosphate isomerase B
VKLALACDHAGRALYEVARRVLGERGVEVLDWAPAAGARVDYPLYALKVARAVASGEVDRGILICGTGIGMSIAANKVAGVRAGLVHDAYTARMTRAHNDANILCLGERVIGPGVAEECIQLFLDTAFEGGRHAERLAQIEEKL